VAAYWRVLPGEFQFDDAEFVVDNAGIKDLGAFGSAAHWLGALRSGRPLVELTFALNYAYGGLEPWNFHLTNLLIHLAAVVLAWSVARRLLRLAGAASADGQALVVAGLFALHPLQSEAVSYVWQRGESLAALLYLAALACLLRADEEPATRSRPAWLLGGFLTFLLGLATKATVVTLPAAWLLLTALVPAPAARDGLVPWRRRLAPALALLALDAAFSLRLLFGLQGPDVGLGTGLSPWTYLLTQLRVLPTYLRLLAWPSGQSVDWYLLPGRLLTQPATTLSGLLVVAAAAGALWLALRSRRREDAGGAAARVAGAGLLWFFLVLAPTSSLVPIVDLLVEHRVYLPSLGVFLAATAVAERALSAWAPPRLAPVLAVATWLALAGLLHARNAAWVTRRALWTDAAAQAPENPRAWTNLGTAASREGRSEEALGHWQRGLALTAAEPAVRCRILGNVGLEQLKLGRLEEAEASLRRAVDLERWPSVENGLASVLMARGKLIEAEAVLVGLLAREPGHLEALTSLGQLHLLRGDPAGALPPLQQALAVDPDLAQGRYLLARALSGLGRPTEACAALSALPRGLDRALAARAAGAWRDLGCSGR
jgi:tetratricopeptide (TPR) repeat protein